MFARARTPIVWTCACAVLLACSTGSAAATPWLRPESIERLAAEPVLRDSVTVPDSTASFAHDTTATAAPAAPAAEESKPPKKRNAIGMFVDDAWYVLSSPARMNWYGAAWTAGTLGATAALYTNDEQVQRTLRRQGAEPVYREALDVGEFVEPVGFMGRTNAIYAGGLVIGYFFKIQPLTTVTSELLESHMISGGIRNLAKLAVGRAQPFRGEGPHHFTPGHGTSFPSGHSSVIFEVATITSMNIRRWPYTVVAYSAATALALQRIDARAHWPSDVLPSAVSGYWISRTIVERHRERAAEDKAARFGLIPDPNGLRLVWSF